VTTAIAGSSDMALRQERSFIAVLIARGNQVLMV